MKRIPSLDGLRAISIALVVLGHLGNSFHAPLIFKQHYTQLGVEIFFVISGFLITSILLKERERTGSIDLADFYKRRAYRIFPAAFVFMLIAVIWFWPLFHWYDIAAGVLYVSNFNPIRPWIFGQLWSLGVEEQFYFLWPGVLKLWHSHRRAIVAFVFIGTPFATAMCYWLHINLNRLGAWPGVAAPLAAGCFLAVYRNRMPVVRLWMAFFMLAALGAIPMYAANTPAKTLFLLFVLQPVRFASMAGLVLHVMQRPYWLLNWTPVVWLGRISYSLYLWQQPFCANPHLHSPILPVLALVFAIASYHLIEKPFLRLRDRGLDRESKTRQIRTSLHVRPAPGELYPEAS